MDAPRARVVIHGTGKLSALLMKYAPASGLSVVGVTTSDADKDGLDAGQVLLGEPNGVPITTDRGRMYQEADATCLLYGGRASTQMVDVLEDACMAGLDCITSVSMTPDDMGPGEFERLESVAIATGTRVLGTGLIPGFQFDVVPSTLAAAMPDPVTVRGTRASIIATWSDHVLTNEAGIGQQPGAPAATLSAYLDGSLRSLASGLGLHLDAVESGYVPMVADQDCRVGPVPVAAGQVCGFHYWRSGTVSGNERVRLDWWSTTGEPGDREEGTRAFVEGPDGLSASLQLTLPADGYPGTAARMIKSVVPLARLAAGMRVPVEVPVV